MTKKHLKTLLLLGSIISGAANAEWAPLAIGKEDAATFIDLESKRKMGNSAEMWSAIVYLKPREVGANKKIMSLRELDEFDCKSNKFRTLTLIGYSDKLATGSIVIADYSIGEWANVPSKSIAEIQWHKACY